MSQQSGAMSNSFHGGFGNMTWSGGANAKSHYNKQYMGQPYMPYQSTSSVMSAGNNQFGIPTQSGFQDLAYMNQRHRTQNTGRSLSDFASEYQGSRPGNNGNRHRMMPQFQGAGDQRIANWLQSLPSSEWKTASVNMPMTEDRQQGTMRSVRHGVKVSPRSSGRHQMGYRARSGERPMYPQRQNRGFTNILYTFPHSSDGRPFLVKVEGSDVTLRKVKEKAPKSGNYRFEILNF